MLIKTAQNYGQNIYQTDLNNQVSEINGYECNFSNKQ
jgi:hypothetical protein